MGSGMLRWALLSASLLQAAGCSDEGAPVQEARAGLTVALPAIDVDPGAEATSLCATVSLDNEDPLWVEEATFRAGPGWHHSEWFTVPAGTYPGPDGVWSCDERGFDLAAIALSGGVLFAQSTQATLERQRFAAGAALAIPARAQVVVQLHLINSGDAPLSTSAALALATIPGERVTTRLAPVAFSYLPLAIPPGPSQVRADCDLRSLPAALDLYWVLPHYHRLGTRFVLESLAGDGTPRLVYDTSAGTGEPLGGAIDPVVALDEQLRFGCDYTNPTSTVVGFGPTAADEMCIFLAFSDAAEMVVGSVTEEGCRVFSWPYAPLAGL